MATLEQQSPDPSTRAGHTHDDTVLMPPQLPPFLATVFDLKPISGSPSTEEVKVVHAAIRTLNSLLHTPEVQDSSNLLMELSQHLFDIQMVRYRERHPVGIFPNDIVYTPPILPSHIPTKLEPVVGPPSDDQLRSAHAALRVSDSFTNVAAVFDADLSMELSQHLFALQLARHIQRSSRVRPSATRPAFTNHNSTPDPNTTRGPNERRDADTDTRPTEAPQDGTATESGPNETQPPGVPRRDGRSLPQERESSNALQETNKLLVDVVETLKNVNRVLVGTQNSLARGLNNAWYSIGAHSVLNDQGETPEIRGLPTLQNSWGHGASMNLSSLSMNALAQYLQFYGIGTEMIDESEELTIKSGMENEAKAILKRRVYSDAS